MTFDQLWSTLRQTAAEKVTAGTSKYAIGRAAGLNAGSVSRFMSGKATKHGPDFITLARMAAAMGMLIHFSLVEDPDADPDFAANCICANVASQDQVNENEL